MPTSFPLRSLDPSSPHHTPCNTPPYHCYSTGIAEGYELLSQPLSEAQEPAQDFEELAELEEEEAGVQSLCSDDESCKAGSEADDSTSTSDSTDPEDIMVGTPYQVRAMLARHMLFIEDPAAEIIGDKLISAAKGILNRKRLSVWSEEKQEQVKEGIKDYAMELEATFVVNLMNHLLGTTRMIAPGQELTQDDLQREQEGVARAWQKDHLRVRYNVDFLSGCIPKIRTGDKYHDRLIDEIPRVENPKPDVAFGIYEKAFLPYQHEILNNNKNDLAGPHCYGIFLVIEAKCMNHSIEEAENQCIRSGCAMVNARRLLNQAATLPHKRTPASGSAAAIEYPRPDMESFAFALAVGSSHAHMFVSWALEMDSKDSVQWHMHFLRDYSFRRPEDLNQLHHDMNNIQDWGLSKQKNKLVQHCETIYSLDIIQPKPKKQKKDDQKEKEGQENTADLI